MACKIGPDSKRSTKRIKWKVLHKLPQWISLYFSRKSIKRSPFCWLYSRSKSYCSSYLLQKLNIKENSLLSSAEQKERVGAFHQHLQKPVAYKENHCSGSCDHNGQTKIHIKLQGQLSCCDLSSTGCTDSVRITDSTSNLLRTTFFELSGEQSNLFLIRKA